jgi:hypothetical protein
MGILRDRMFEGMKLRNFNPATQESYFYAATRLPKHYRRPPDQLDKEEIRSYLLYLTTARKWSPVTLNNGRRTLCCDRISTVTAERSDYDVNLRTVQNLFFEQLLRNFMQQTEISR